MNEAHEHCGSDEWRQMIREVILPWALGDTDLGDDVLEVGPGYGATTDVLGTVGAAAHLGRDRRRARGHAARALRRRPVGRDRQRRRHTASTTPTERFTGAACFTMLHHVPTVELQDRLFAEVARVLRPGAALVASDSLGSDELAAAPRGRHVQPGRPRVAARPSGGGGFRRRRGADQPVRLGGHRPNGLKYVRTQRQVLQYSRPGSARNLPWRHAASVGTFRDRGPEAGHRRRAAHDGRRGSVRHPGHGLPLGGRHAQFDLGILVRVGNPCRQVRPGRYATDRQRVVRRWRTRGFGPQSRHRPRRPTGAVSLRRSSAVSVDGTAADGPVNAQRRR